MWRAFTRHSVAGAVFLVALPFFVPFGLTARFVWVAAPIGFMIARSVERSQDRSLSGTPAGGIES